KLDGGKDFFQTFIEAGKIKKTDPDAAGNVKYMMDKSLKHSVWEKVTESADRHNSPGKFTAFIGYEWTSNGLSKEFMNLHRVVIFKDGKEKANKVLPFSANDSVYAEDLWNSMEKYESSTGGEVIAIPHNSNLSAGMMFAPTDLNGKPMVKSQAEARSRWEPLAEVTQMKGTSETHPLLSPDDEFSDYEIWDDIEGRSSSEELSREDRENKPYGYIRSALKLGMQEQSKLGVNPFKFGMVGGTDSHTSLSTADDDNFWGKMPHSNPHKGRMFERMLPYIGPLSWEVSASGYTGVWAKENTREALFDAMKRKEVYASTGPRMTVRFFGGWDYEADDAFSPNLAKIGYEKGVPMGGDLTAAPDDRSPRFLIRAVRDPEGANLGRVQVIKGWHDKNGELHEKVYNVALSDNRKPNWRGKVKPVGNTVDIPDASYTNSIGDPELAVVWEDPDFNPGDPAFYYVRVLEIPTPRWTASDVKQFELKDVPQNIPMIAQERAYTSPIWYSPVAKTE
ncbi:DUF3604 domain-containing protein, partial [Porticoccaceae bacterium]|nr:DUF3604 domain-containing protein [Porticoccaceae bacterium]